MIWHEIVKYSPKNYDDNGVYIKDEWSSRSDIGAVYDGKPFTLEEYLDVEQRYVNVVLSIMRATNCKYMTIQYLEADKDYIAKQIKATKYREIDYHLLMSISLLEEGRRISIERMSDILRLALREYIYVELSNKEHGVFVKFGYDYYLNVACSLSNEELEHIARKESLFLDPR